MLLFKNEYAGSVEIFFELTRHLPWKQGWSLLLKDLISKVAAAAATLVEEGIEIGGELAPGEDMFDEPDIRRAE